MKQNILKSGRLAFVLTALAVSLLLGCPNLNNSDDSTGGGGGGGIFYTNPLF
jgi:hypothetical protein